MLLFSDGFAESSIWIIMVMVFFCGYDTSLPCLIMVFCLLVVVLLNTWSLLYDCFMNTHAYRTMLKLQLFSVGTCVILLKYSFSV